MQITRDQFIAQFWPPVQVHALKLWRLRSKAPPDHLPRAIYDALLTCAGIISIEARQFRQIVEPVIVDLHRVTPRGQRPEAKDLLGRVYDALDAAGIEVMIRPPLEVHGHRVGQGSNEANDAKRI